jgi:hypothetical protein
MLTKITYFPILGKPLVMWLGIVTLLCLLFTAAISVMNKKGIHKIPLKWHSRMAGITIVLAIIHGILAVAAYF